MAGPGKSARNGISLAELLAMFPDERMYPSHGCWV